MRRDGVKSKIANCIILVLLSLCFVGCDFFYSIVYSEFTIQINNNSEYDITEVIIYKDGDFVQADNDLIAVDESREYIVTERSLYTVKGTLSDATTFMSNIDFTSIERKIIEVE